MPGPIKPQPQPRKRKAPALPPPIPCMVRSGISDYGVTAIGWYAWGYVYGAVRSRPIPMEMMPATTPEQRLFIAGQVSATCDRASIARGERDRFDCEAAWLRLLAERKAEAKRQREAKAAAEAAAANPQFGRLR